MTRMGECSGNGMGNKSSSASRGSLGADHTQALLQLIREAAHCCNQHVVFSDFVEVSCLAMSNAVGA